jgi:hypothetical protein
LRLEELFFPVQEVHANPEHDIKGERVGTSLKHVFGVQPIENQPGLFGAELMVECDRESSRNPPYFFQLRAYALIRVEHGVDVAASQQIATTTGFSVLVGAARERLLELTSRAPWGRFVMGIMQLATQQRVESSGSVQ